MSTNSRTVLSSFPPMKSNALHITRDSIRIFVPLRPLYGVPVYFSVGGRCPHRPAASALVPGRAGSSSLRRDVGDSIQPKHRQPKSRPWAALFYLDQKNDHPIGWSFWQGQKGSNSRHAVLETAALPTELYPYMVGLRGLEPGTGRL